MYFGVEASFGSFFFLFLAIAREESKDTDHESLADFHAANQSR